ncbi:kinesin-like protein KIF18B [Spea bombifrons]|uniref:kinesin-like protein KIF18B n=1 Tax=Spea bombifrons TaxID=233779 RepID=UPI00234AF15F|nr:kinesin-like protein KIF18B [Spea bombifrons]
MTAAAAPEEGNVSVVVRVRPPNSREQEGNHCPVVHVVDDSILVFDPDEPDTSGVFSGLRGYDGTKRKGKDLKFIFDRVFGESATQQDVFQHTTKEILDGVLNGYNCSVFAYGATGAGKTHTMLGTEADPGVMYLTMEELYRRIEAIQEEKSCEVLISYLEVYNEQIQDLLAPKGFLAIREDPQKGVVVQGLSFHQPKSADQLLQMLANGNLNRTQHPTDANASSSRSHAVFQIYVKQQDRAASINQDVRVAKMSLIDLAGSERASSTNAKGERLREGANINRSLLALINVINALADAKSKKAHIPYRDSKLTRLLKDSIGGNCRTVMIAAISPSSLSYDDTYNTLKYANRAKEIKLSLKSNVVNLDCHISKYAAVCEELRAEVAELRERLRSYEMKEDHPDVLPVCPSPERNQSTRLEEPRDSSSPEQGRRTQKRTTTRRSSQRLNQKPLKRPPEDHEKQDSDSENFSFTEHETSLCVGPEPLNGDTERLIGAFLHVIRKQSETLKRADLQTPEMDAEVQELERLALRVRRDFTTEQVELKLPDTDAGNPIKEEAPLLPPIDDAEADVKPQIAVAPVASFKKRHPLKRCRRELLPDASPTLRSPVVPAKRRREAESRTPSKAHETRLPSTPEAQVKRPRKSSIPSRSRPNLRSGASLFHGKSNDAVVGQPSRKTSLCTPKQATQAKSNAPANAITKARVPLATSALQNCASVPAAALAARDLNATFDVSEDVFLAPDLNATVTFGTSEFSGWENVNSQHIDSTFGKSSEVAVFTMNGRSVKLTTSSQMSSVAKSYPHRRRRSNSSSSMRAGSSTVGQSKIAKLQLGAVKKPLRPPTIAESCSPQRQSGKKSVKGNTAFGRSVSAAPATRFMQLTAVKS